MGHWIIDDNNILEEDTHGNMRQYRNIETGQLWLVRVDVYNIDNDQFVIQVEVNGECVSALHWYHYHGGKMRRNQLSLSQAVPVGFDIGWRNVQKQVKAS